MKKLLLSLVLSFNSSLWAEDATDEEPLITPEKEVVKEKTSESDSKVETEKQVPKKKEKVKKTKESMGSESGIPYGKYQAGGFVGTFAGFGIGHMVAGRWTSLGWIFTFSEAALMGTIIYRASKYQVGKVDGTLALSEVGFIGMRVWEIIDIWANTPHQPRPPKPGEETSDNLDSRTFAVFPNLQPQNYGLMAAWRF